MAEDTLHRQNIIACIWDFDKTLIPGYMQAPLFDYYDVDEDLFWNEVNGLYDYYKERNQHLIGETAYLNHIISYIRAGIFKGLNNNKLRELGKEIKFYPGLPDFFKTLQEIPKSDPAFKKHDIVLEHYIVSTGLAAMIRGCEIAPYVENIYGCELLENPPAPGYLNQDVLLDIEKDDEAISQIGTIVDNTIKTRYIFEINKGTNKHPELDVNSKVAHEDRRIPMKNMIYIADGPSDVPVFSVIRKSGGHAYAVYEKGNRKEFAQNDELLRTGRVDSYGRADYREKSDTHMWLTMHVENICQRIVEEQEYLLSRRISKPPRHIRKDKEATKTSSEQTHLFPIE